MGGVIGEPLVDELTDGEVTTDTDGFFLDIEGVVAVRGGTRNT
jgi:hypothetical protein